MLKIVLDPGHGGKDRANKGPSGKYVEADGVLDIAKRMRGVLVKVGVEVLLTREADLTLSLKDRTAMANDWNADALISIHTNAASANVRGTETYCSVYDRTGSRGRKLADALQAAMVKVVGQYDRGVKVKWNSAANDDYYGIIRYAKVPAVIVEPEFHSSLFGEAWLLDAGNRQKLADAMARAVLNWGGVEPVDKRKDAVPIDVEGKTVWGILVENRTYAPVREVAEMCGRKVDWDDKTGRVTIK